MTGTKKRLHTGKDHVIGLVLAAAYLSMLLATAGDLGFSRDEGFYFKAARNSQEWMEELADRPAKALEPWAIEKYWRYNHEHPAMMKVLFGISNGIFHHKIGATSSSTGYRLPGMIAAALAIYLIFIWTASAFGRAAGMYSSMAFALMPRVFYHAHLACFDMPITAFWLLVCYLYWRSLESKRFGIAAGIVFGFALCIKLNAFFLPFVLGLHYLLLFAYRRKLGSRATGAKPKPWAFLSGFVFAPPIFILSWPWLWYDTWKRLLGYVGFHGHHAHYNTAWLGENIIQAPTPISLPLVMTLLTIPTVTIALCAGGALLVLRRNMPAFAEKRVFGLWPDKQRLEIGSGFDLLIALNAIFPIALISLPQVPIFGGTKHWMPAMPFWAMLAGMGVARLGDATAKLLPKLSPRAVRYALAFLLLLPPLQQTATSHPFGLMSYVPLAGGAPGAANLGMTRQFWGYSTAGVLPWLNERVPKNGRVFFHDTSSPSVNMFKEDKLLRSDIRLSAISGSRFALVHHELHMIVVESWIWNRYKIHNPAHVLTYQGVPIVSVYARP